MLYYFLVVWFFFLSISGAAMVLGQPESSAHVVYGASVIFVVASLG
jgi:hypothetical protein